MLSVAVSVRVYVDIDDVICETAATLCLLASQQFGRTVAYGQVRQFDLQQVFGLDDSEMTRFVALSHSREWLMRYPVTPGAVEGVLALRSAGLDVEFVTGRPASSGEMTVEWLRGVGLGDFPVTYVDKYGRYFRGSHGHSGMIRMPELVKRRFDFAIDDSPVVLPALAAAWPTSRILVLARPWNETFGMSSNMMRVADWDAIVRDIRQSL